MKTNFILISIYFIITINLQAQEFAPIGAKWHFQETFFFNGNIDVITTESIGDTVINDISCRIIKKSKSSCDVPLSNNFYLSQEDNKISLYDPERDAFDMVIDFDADIGDSWSFYHSYALFAEEKIVEVNVDSISYFFINPDDSLRIQHVTLTNVFHDHSIHTKIIEKLGFEKALLPYDFTTLCDSNYERIRCYEDSNIGLVIFDSVECNFISTAIEDKLISSDLEIFPNPTSNILHFKTKELQLESVQIFSLEGKLMSEYLLEQSAVDMSYLDRGLYFLKIKTDKGLIVEKVIVNRN